jgi:hypothetical protein
MFRHFSGFLLTTLQVACRLLYIRPDGPVGKEAQMAAYGSRTIGDTIEGVGTIEQVSLTAYRVGTTWVPFARVDQMAKAEILVTFDGTAL